MVLSGQVLARNQEEIPLTRLVAIEDEAIKYRFTVFVQNVDIKISPKILYYWFFDGKISQNIGGYAGFLLHGKYQVFTKSGQLIEQGTFENGVKEGVWNYWNPSGGKIRMVAYQNGWKNGNEVLYHSGNESEITPYKMGVIHGDKQILKQDTSITIRFRNGVEVKKKDKDTPKKRMKLFGKKKKTKKADEPSDKEIPKKKE